MSRAKHKDWVLAVQTGARKDLGNKSNAGGKRKKIMPEFDSRFQECNPTCCGFHDIGVQAGADDIQICEGGIVPRAGKST